MLLHVIDISDSDYLDKIDVVDEVLKELGAESERVLKVFNKIDLVESTVPMGVNVSARYGTGIRELLSIIGTELEILA
ncbi:MAG TPA: hypothetical protein GXX58_05585 [Gelria sp.]|nr:hypothetical protein [Gelria sp.]